MALIATTTMQSWLGISGDDTILETILPGCVALLEKHAGRLFTSPAAAVTEVLDGGDAVRGADVLVDSDRAADLSFVALKEEPNAATLTSVSFRQSVGDDWEVKTLADFEVDGRLVYALAADFPTGKRNVRIIYDFGYAEDGAPADAHLLLLDMVKMKYERRGVNSAVRRASKSGVSVAWSDFGDMAKTFMEMADALRRPSLVF